MMCEYYDCRTSNDVLFPNSFKVFIKDECINQVYWTCDSFSSFFILHSCVNMFE